jgi:hypothetical protein
MVLKRIRTILDADALYQRSLGLFHQQMQFSFFISMCLLRSKSDPTRFNRWHWSVCSWGVVKWVCVTGGLGDVLRSGCLSCLLMHWVKLRAALPPLHQAGFIWGGGTDVQTSSPLRPPVEQQVVTITQSIACCWSNSVVINRCLMINLIIFDQIFIYFTLLFITIILIFYCLVLH